MQSQSVLNQPLVFRKKVFKMFGNAISILDQQNNLVFYVKQKAFKLREDIRVYADQAQTKEMLTIKARQIMDFKAAYDVVDAETNETVGALRRKGWASIIQDKWEVLDAKDQVIGDISEDSTILALVRRFLSNLVPQNYHFRIADKEVAMIKQRFNPFIFKADFTLTGNGLIDPRLALAGAVLLMTIEGRQQ